jgi:uncharacterized damage-inducible protein DinB
MEFKQLADYFIEEIKAENVSARKCLERIPESVYKFKPHEKSMEMGYLTQLVAEIPMWISTMIIDSNIDFATFSHFQLSNTKALLEQYDKGVKGAIDALEKLTEEQLKTEFTLKNNGQLLYATPKLKGIGETINHWVHHRGQLTVYMRLNDIAVPSIYGPSADERKF